MHQIGIKQDVVVDTYFNVVLGNLGGYLGGCIANSESVDAGLCEDVLVQGRPKSVNRACSF